MPQASATAVYTAQINNRATELLSQSFILPGVLGQSVTNDYKNQGNTVEFYRDPKITINDASDSAGSTFNAVTQDKDVLTVDYYREAPIKWGDLTMSLDNLQVSVERYAGSVAKHMAADIETKLFFVITNEGGIPATNEVGTIGTVINEDLFIELNKKFNQNDVPKDGRVVVLSPDHYAQALKLDIFKNAEFVQPSDIGGVSALAQLPRLIYGMRVYESNQLSGNDALSSVAGTNTGKISIAFYIDTPRVVMVPLETNLAGNAYDVATDSIDGYTMRTMFGYDIDERQNKMRADVLYGIKNVYHNTVSNAAAVMNAFPILGGI